MAAGEFPAVWKASRLVLLRKEGKPADSPSGYRPICLLDEVGKLFERVIAHRLVQHLQTDGPDLADCQFGFRVGLSTIHAIERVRAHSEAETAQGGVVLAVSLDIVNAFNTLPWDKIREALVYHRVPPYLRRVVGAYLSQRCIEYPGRDGLYRREVNRGVPQGSVLGPLLWDLGYDAVLRVKLPAGLKVFCYADDTLLMASGDEWDRTTRLAELGVARVVAELGRLGLRVAPHKTEAVWFYDRTREGPPAETQLRVGDAVVRVGSQINYLGLILTSHWHWGAHFERLTPRVEGAVGALCRLLPNLGGPRDGVRRLYVGVVQSMLLYGAPIWAGDLMADKRMVLTLRTFQRKMAIRVARGYRTISHAAASAVAGLPPLELVAESRAQVYRAREDLRQGGWRVTARGLESLKCQARRRLFDKWREWLSLPQNVGQRAVGAILPHLDMWGGRRFGGVTYRLCQIFTGHGCFGEYLARIRRESTTRCHHCGADRDSAQHTLEECAAWDGERRVLISQVGSDLSLPTLVGKMLGSEPNWRAVASFCESVLKQKEAAERERERASAPSRRERRGGGARRRPC